MLACAHLVYETLDSFYENSSSLSDRDPAGRCAAPGDRVRGATQVVRVQIAVDGQRRRQQAPAFKPLDLVVNTINDL